ncbi:P-loop containing nucleoside triphosphate hydrolase protein [Globomyces pollinis-pini]|nr:P-loop containing nucleoside triphosphate hydrolase protein [Globomyces pollinis-pini]
MHTESNLFSETILPSKELENQWENLVFEDSVKEMLLNYVYTGLLFSDKGVDSKIIPTNRVGIYTFGLFLVLLHGPPGTGKTTLCKGLAQKIAIRLADRYTFGKLVEISANNVFSKFFAESSKTVIKLFIKLHAMLDNQDAFVCVLIDEVESLTAARKAALNGSEPSDAIRVVNCILTEIDKLRERKNVLIFTTSNITEAIDIAFLDRADVKLHLGNPTSKAIYQIITAGLKELMRCEILPTCTLLPYDQVQLTISNTQSISHEVLKICQIAEGMSGRTLTKLPFLVYAKYIQVNISSQ